MKKKDIISLIVFIVGIITLIVGVVFLVITMLSKPGLQDGEYLISAKEWVLEGEETNCLSPSDEESETNCIDGVSSSNVIWKFTEIGKGTLTTNNHLNDYDFIWALEDGKLKIKTDWLYDLENEYDYDLNQKEGILTLTADEDTFKFVANFESE